MSIVLSLAAGLLFGIGLIISGMANPAKLLGFLDLAGPWDPSLALVMCGALAVSAIGFGVAARRRNTLLGLPMQLPRKEGLDARLVGGSLVFGVGWGLAGVCPGLALVLLGAGEPKAADSCTAMVAGFLLFEWLNRRGSA
jgi:uncharacterized protein